MKNRVLILLFLLPWLKAPAQDYDNLPFYYPDQIEWPLEISVDVHVMQCSKNNPRNFTPADTGTIHEIFKLVNQMYNHLQPPTLKVPNVLFFDESKIYFQVRKTHFHVDSTGWMAEWMEPMGHVKIERYDAGRKTFALKGRMFRNYQRPDGIALEYKNGKTRKLTCDSAWFENDFSYVRIKERIDTTNIHRLGYYAKRDANCQRTNYEKYGASDPNHLHVFLTQSVISKIVFGCGPGKDFLNLSNAWGGDNWVIAQLLAHELGHCLGLYHTNSPQFPDLPKRDQFGWLPCDSISVSNNIMGYNVCRSYLSPMQIASVHRMFQTREDHIRLTPLRQYNPRRLFKIKHDMVLQRNMVLNGDLLVEKNATLTLTGTFFIHAQSRIILEDGAVLNVDNGRILVMSGGKNANVVYCRKFGSHKAPKQKGEIKTTNNGKIIGLQIP